MTYAIVWEFMVSAGRTADFEAAYGPDGPWSDLFRRSAGFIRSSLLRCEDRAGRYLTIDWWTSLEAFEDFRLVFAKDYHALDARLEILTSSEMRLGGFDDSASVV
jgi:heme-degrading monooxygenase HmoA